MIAIDYERLARSYADDRVRAVGLFGSHARGDHGPYSDIDIVRFLHDDAASEPATYLVDGHFVVVSDVGPSTVAHWFTSPEAATDSIRGVTFAKALMDPDGYLRDIIRRAKAFEWTADMQARADVQAGGMMVGVIEEVQKTLEGLRRNDIGRMLNGKHGLTWWMLRVMKIKRGVLLSGDNGLFPEVVGSMGDDSQWSRLCRAAFGIGGSFTVEEELLAGLRLYSLTARLLRPDLLSEHVRLVDEALRRIDQAHPEADPSRLR